MIKKVVVDKGLCIGCGSCISVCEKCFEFDDDGKSKVKPDCDLVANESSIKEAEAICPVQAIDVTEE